MGECGGKPGWRITDVAGPVLGGRSGTCNAIRPPTSNSASSPAGASKGLRRQLDQDWLCSNPRTHPHRTLSYS